MARTRTKNTVVRLTLANGTETWLGGDLTNAAVRDFVAEQERRRNDGYTSTRVIDGTGLTHHPLQVVEAHRFDAAEQEEPIATIPLTKPKTSAK